MPGFVPDTYLHGPNYAERVRIWSKYPEFWEGKEIRYAAEAEVVLLHGNETAGNAGAIAAAEVFRTPGPPPRLPIVTAGQQTAFK